MKIQVEGGGVGGGLGTSRLGLVMCKEQYLKRGRGGRGWVRWQWGVLRAWGEVMLWDDKRV